LSQSDAQFKELFGITKKVCYEMLSVLKVAQAKRHKKDGRRPKLSVGEQLFLTLQYWLEYRTMAHIAYDFGVAKSTVSDTIMQVENTLIQTGPFHLSGKKSLLSNNNAGRTLVVDVTKSPIERPKKNKKNGIPVNRSGIQ
jgi:predicted DNA-binding protein YlxM (UPF0122 family)